MADENKVRSQMKAKKRNSICNYIVAKPPKPITKVDGRKLSIQS